MVFSFERNGCEINANDSPKIPPRGLVVESHVKSRHNFNLKFYLNEKLINLPASFLIFDDVHCSATRGLLATDHASLNHGQVTWTTPGLAAPLLTHTNGRTFLDRFSVHRGSTRWVFSGTGLELVTKPATIRYLFHSATTAT
ncbi:uncharacterized protein TNCV_199571 [Trichonephila clavipes]|nr:uncharacterized protein TNCV_199571 [Trichonephila clavipes]